MKVCVIPKGERALLGMAKKGIRNEAREAGGEEEEKERAKTEDAEGNIRSRK